jgi:hypothetical protein
MLATRFLRCALAFFAMLAVCAPAHALLFRTYLSISGSDANPCTVALPCRLLPAALAAVNSGGEIWMLDSANYNTGTVDINKSVTILAIPGAVASILATGGTPAMSIATASVKVILRNVVITNNKTSPGTDGLRMTAEASLTVEDSVVAGIPEYGLFILARATVRVTRVVFRDNYRGLYVNSGTIADVSYSSFSGHDAALIADGPDSGIPTQVSLTDTVFTENYEGAMASTLYSTAVARMFVTRCTFSHNSYGLFSEAVNGGTTTVSVSRSMIAGNTVNGLIQSGTGVLKSLGNNHLVDNAGDVSGTLTTIAPQ